MAGKRVYAGGARRRRERWTARAVERRRAVGVGYVKSAQKGARARAGKGVARWLADVVVRTSVPLFVHGVLVYVVLPRVVALASLRASSCVPLRAPSLHRVRRRVRCRVGTRRVDIVVDNCAICRNHIMDLCKNPKEPDGEGGKE